MKFTSNMTTPNITRRRQRGFTIVELLIVIVVIAILAAISIVAYTGIQNRAHDSAVQQDLRQLGTAFELFQAEHGYYPAPGNTDMAELRVSVTRGSYHERWSDDSTNNLYYCHNNEDAEDFALVARSKSGAVWQFNGSVSRYTGEAYSSTTQICQAAGAPTTSTSAVHRTLVRTGSNWASWLRS